MVCCRVAHLVGSNLKKNEGALVVFEKADLARVFHPDNLGLRNVRVVFPLIFFLKKKLTLKEFFV